MIDVKRVWIFGSRAMGGFRRNSDIDLAFERGNASSKDFDAFWARLSDEAEILLPLDLVDFETCQPELRKAILAHGKVVYECD